MKKTLQVGILASALSVSNPSYASIENTSEVIDDTKTGVSSLLSSDKFFNQSVYNDLLISNFESQNSLVDALNSQNLFPRQVNTIGLDRMSSAMLGNIKQGGLDVIHPPFVDYGWFERVYCAGTIKGFLSSLKKPSDRTGFENSYINREGIDAWMLPDELRRAGLYYQFYDMMNHFDFEKVGQNDIVKDKQDYYQSLLQTGNHLKNHGVTGSILFMYFNLSSYKWRVKEYNQEKLLKNPNAHMSINTHQAIYLGNGDMEFQASDIFDINSESKESINYNLDVVTYIAKFVQQRGGYRSALNTATKNTIIENMHYFHSMIDLEVNGKKIDLYQELNKKPSDRLKISSQDDIKISGPILMDGFHDTNSPNKYISKNNHARTLFYFEFVTIGTYTPSELLIPNDNLKNSHGIESKYDYITDQLEITNTYYLRKDENLSLKLKESILRYEFGKYRELKYDDYEVEMMNRIQSLKDGSRERTSLNFDLISYREQKIQSLINSLNQNQINQFYANYKAQIQGLQLMGYMQNEADLNPGAVNINAPIPYFETSNIPALHFEYVELRKKEIISSYIENADMASKDVDIFFFPADNFATIYTQLESKLKLYSDRYESFDKLSSLDLLKKHKLIDIIIDKYSQNPDIDLTKGIVPSMQSISIPLDFIDAVLKNLLQESFVEDVKLSDLDSMVIEIIAKNREDYDILAHILVQESYEKGIPLRKIMKEVGRMLGKISSYGDFQLRLTNLKNAENSLVKLPNVEQLQRAIEFLDEPEIQRVVDRRKLRYEEDIEDDLELVRQISDKIKYVEFLTPEQRLEVGNQVYDLLKELFRFNDSRQINIVGKVVQTSLILDKMHEHYYNLNGWLLASGVHTDEILYNSDLQTRYKKLLLVINNRSEKTTLVGTGENYILRVLEALGDDIHDESYPKLKRDYKGKIEYNKDVLSQRLDFYKSRLDLLNKDYLLAVSDLILLIDDIKDSNYSALKYYELFKNQNIKDFLSDNGLDTYLLPTMDEFENTAFRELFYDYAKNPVGMEAPKNWDNAKNTIAYSGILGVIASVGLGSYGIFRRKLKKQNKTFKDFIKEIKNKISK